MSKFFSKKYFTYQSADGVTDISAKIWEEEKVEPRAILQIAHGMVEYKERYDRFAKWLSSKGVLVCANDHLGHGDSVSDTKDWGYVTEKDPSDVMIKDMHTLRTIVSEEYPDLPYFMLGHSMGSFLLRKYLAFYGEGLSGAIIMGTGQNPELIGKMGMFLTRQAAHAKGWRFRSHKIQNLTYNKYYKKYDLTNKDSTNSWLTRDPEIVEKYRSDPKCSYLFTLSGHMALFEAVTFDANEENNRKIPAKLPMLLVSGAEDPVGSNGEGVKAAYDLLKKTGHENVTMKLYPGARHEILNELEETKTEVFEDIKNWIFTQKL